MTIERPKYIEQLMNARGKWIGEKMMQEKRSLLHINDSLSRKFYSQWTSRMSDTMRTVLSRWA